MIKANELRIGNWLNINGSPAPIQAGWFTVIASHQEHLLPPHDPIPLTPEILEKCGFENSGEISFGLDIKDFVMVKRIWVYFPDKERYPNDKNWYLGLENKHGSQTSGIIVNHLHQLQNLYFALTSEELEVNL